MAPIKTAPGSDVSWGQLRPGRVSEWEERDGKVTLIVPRYGRGPIGSLLARLLRARPGNVHLDEVGSFVWRRIDGVATVAELADAMRREFGEKIEPVEDRLVLFMKTLLRGRFATITTR